MLIWPVPNKQTIPKESTIYALFYPLFLRLKFFFYIYYIEMILIATTHYDKVYTETVIAMVLISEGNSENVARV